MRRDSEGKRGKRREKGEEKEGKRDVDSACHPSEVGGLSTSALVIGALHQRHIHAPTNDATSSQKKAAHQGKPLSTDLLKSGIGVAQA